MNSVYFNTSQRLFSQVFTQLQRYRCLHTTSICCKSKAGRHKVSKMNNKPLTYDEAFKPHMIGVRKGWQNVHTGNLHGEDGAYERLYEDRLIRKFMEGTFHRLLATGLVIKRRFNIVEVVAHCYTPWRRDALPFLKSYSERLLSATLKCNVKIHIYIVQRKDVEYKYI